MTRKLRRAGLAAGACLVVTMAAACGSSASSSQGAASPGASGAHGTLIVFGAGTLSAPFTAELAAFKKANPGVTEHAQFGASGDMVKSITQLHQPADVLGVADYSLIPKLMFTASATWYVGFVSNQITFAYTSHSKGAGQLTAANWYKVLAQPGVHIGRSNPAADPSGYQTLQMLQLANGYYHDPKLSASVLRNSPDSSVAETETSLIAAVQSGQIDYLAIYKSTAQEQHLKYIALPSQINLSDPAMAAGYGKVTIQAGSLGALTAKPIIYGLTIPTSAPNAALGQQFIRFVLGPQGQAIMRSNGFVVISPALASDQTKIPATLRALTTAWPSSGG
ncbi:MAG TPA: extracellular solute-binding protein [Streptosporangiaceae bacterium]|nr:extracellular solute-binding protein [Streptosporangiaceae bacterium]